MSTLSLPLLESIHWHILETTEKILSKTLITTIFPLIFLYSAILPPASQAQSSQTLDVHVNNFPETQRIKGAVSIEGTTSHAKFIKREGIVVPPSRRNELSELSYAGVVETDGFTSISLNVQGEIKSSSFTPGAVGVLLVPDEEPIVRALREAKRIPFPLESAANLKSGDSTYFDSEQSLHRVAFPRYRVYLYNTVNKAVEANIYLYLSN
jgi:hypothetical protein